MSDERYERNPDFICRKIVDEMLLVPVRQNVADTDYIFTMSPLGSFIWERLDGRQTLGDIQAAITDVYDADPDVVAVDVPEFVGQLEAVGAVRRV